jgi:hypothetical protein
MCLLLRLPQQLAGPEPVLLLPCLQLLLPLQLAAYLARMLLTKCGAGH